jgi:hypothetical protein
MPRLPLPQTCVLVCCGFSLAFQVVQCVHSFLGPSTPVGNCLTVQEVDQCSVFLNVGGPSPAPRTTGGEGQPNFMTSRPPGLGAMVGQPMIQTSPRSSVTMHQSVNVHHAAGMSQRSVAPTFMPNHPPPPVAPPAVSKLNPNAPDFSTKMQHQHPGLQQGLHGVPGFPGAAPGSGRLQFQTQNFMARPPPGHPDLAHRR